MSPQRGSLLLVAMLFAAAISLVLVGYLQLGRTSLQVAHRSFFLHDAANLAEAGLEEAMYSFNQMAAGAAPATAWAGWTIAGTDARKTLTPFNRDQNGVGIVKVYVKGYDGSSDTPTVYSQAVITPFDRSAPIVRTQQASLRIVRGVAAHGLVALNGLSLSGKTFVDSFNSNPTGSPTGPWRAYSSEIAQAKASVVVLGGKIMVASGKIYGDLYLGPGVAPPDAKDYTGTVTPDYQATYTLPAFPTPAGVSRSYDVGSSLPGTLPVPGHLPADDGRYYYFCRNTTIGTVRIAENRRVVIVGTKTNMGPGMSVAATGACSVYMDGVVTLSKGDDLNNAGWAGALQIFTSTEGECEIGNKSQIVACLYAPRATLTATGSSSSGMLVGYFVANKINASGKMDFHYDEALQTGATGAGSLTVSRWFEVQSAADRATIAGLSGGFLL